MRATKSLCRSLALTGFAVWITSAAAAQNGLPEEFQQIIARGEIAAITQPTFVTASEARIAGDARILGVVVEGQARAFSLNLLNYHEVVNDSIGETDYAAVW